MSKALSSCFCHLIGNIPLGIQKSQSVNNSRLHWTPRHQARICLWALDREKSSLHASESVDNALCSLSRPYRIIFTMSETRNFVHYPVIAIICKKTTLIARLLMSVCWAISFNFFFVSGGCWIYIDLLLRNFVGRMPTFKHFENLIQPRSECIQHALFLVNFSLRSYIFLVRLCHMPTIIVYQRTFFLERDEMHSACNIIHCIKSRVAAIIGTMSGNNTQLPFGLQDKLEKWKRINS